MVDENRPLKLHATIINTIYAKKAAGFRGRGRGGSITNTSSNTAPKERERGPPKLDASALVEIFADFEWSKELLIEKIAICKMGAKKILGQYGDVVGEEYEEIAHVALPLNQD